MKICPSCQTENSESAKFCKECGDSLQPGNKQARAEQTSQEAGDDALQIGKARDVRVNIGIGVNELVEALKTAFGKDDPRPEEVRQQLEEITQTHNRLVEWKILHNHMNDLLTQFGQFGTMINSYLDKSKSFTQKEHSDLIQFDFGETEVDKINDAWRPINRIVNVMLGWVPKIQYIGEGGWSKEIVDIRDDITTHIHGFRLDGNVDQKVKWIRDMKDKKNEFEDFILIYMEISDTNLRETAEELTNTFFRS
jgi:hypothetical protein